MPTQDTQIGLFRKPRTTPLDRVLAEPATALLVGGIVNPFGPTLTAVIVPGKLKAGNKLSVVQLMLNPFSQGAATVGQLVLGSKWRPSAIIRPLFGLPFGSCPTLLLPSVHLDDNHSLSLHAEFLRGFEDARDVLQRVRQYLGNPWDRVSQEIREGAERFVEEDRSGHQAAAADPLSEAEARELAGLLLSEQHAKPELKAFLYSWGGSIKFQREQGMPAMADAAMSLETFQDIFLRITQGCRVPEIDENVSANPITELRETAEVAFHHGYKVRNKAKTEEALTVLVTQLLEVFGASPTINQLLQALDVVKRAVEVEDWESGTASLLVVLDFLRQVEPPLKISKAKIPVVARSGDQCSCRLRDGRGRRAYRRSSRQEKRAVDAEAPTPFRCGTGSFGRAGPVSPAQPLNRR
jgi:hypothetical protein